MNKVSLEVVNFKEELKRIEKEVAKEASMSIERRIDFATENLKVVTPVDTGKARKGWYNKKEKNLQGFSQGIIANDVDYISILNRGHSSQAPRYFIEQVLSKIGILTPD